MKQNWMLFLCYGGLFCLPVAVQAQVSLAPPTQVIRSDYAEPLAEPLAPQHQFDPRRPDRISEPYSPEILVTQILYPDQLPKNVRLSWLTKLSGPLAGFFLGDQGRFERAVQAYEEENYPQAQHFLRPLVAKDGPFQGKATLWLAWASVQRGQVAEAQALSIKLATEYRGVFQREGYFLWLWQTLKQGDLAQAKELLPLINQDVAPGLIEFRLRYVMLVAQVKLQQWAEARESLNQLNTQELLYSPFYGKLKEISGTVAYYENDFLRALNDFQGAKKSDPRGFAAGENNRHIAWLWYFIGNYPEAIRQVDLELARLRPFHQEELTYLKIAALTHLGRGQEIEQLLLKLPVDSPFLRYGAFQTQVFLAHLDRWPQLEKRLEKIPLKKNSFRFYVAILEGNQRFGSQETAQAEVQYQTALKTAEGGPQRWLARYNLLQIELKLHQWQVAQTELTQLARSPGPVSRKRLLYHQLYLAYQQDDLDRFNRLFEPQAFARLEPQIQWDIKRLQGALNLRHDQFEPGLKAILWGLQHGQAEESLRFAVQALYSQNKFQRLLPLIKKNRNQAKGLAGYEVRSLIALKQTHQAQAVLDLSGLNSASLVGLQVELWNQRGKPQKVIRLLTEKLDQSGLPERERKTYSRLLADAWFNQKDYPKARYLYQQALERSSLPQERSELIYTLVLSRYLQKGQPGFERKLKLSLAQADLGAPTRLNLTLLYAHYLSEKQRDGAAETLLVEYEVAYPYQRGKVRLLRIRKAQTQKKWARCVELTQEPPAEATGFELVDLALSGGRCELNLKHNKQWVAQLSALSPPGGYRQDELFLLVGLGLKQQEKFEDSDSQFAQIQKSKLSPQQQTELQLNWAESLLGLGKPEAALDRLGDFRLYPEGPKQRQAMRLTAQAYQAQKKLRRATKIYLRLSFQPGLTPEEQVELKFTLVGLYQKRGEPASAQKIIRQLQALVLTEPQQTRLRGLVPPDPTAPSQVP